MDLQRLCDDPTEAWERGGPSMGMPGSHHSFQLCTHGIELMLQVLHKRLLCAEEEQYRFLTLDLDLAVLAVNMIVICCVTERMLPRRGVPSSSDGEVNGFLREDVQTETVQQRFGLMRL